MRWKWTSSQTTSHNLLCLTLSRPFDLIRVSNRECVGRLLCARVGNEPRPIRPSLLPSKNRQETTAVFVYSSTLLLVYSSTGLVVVVVSLDALCIDYIVVYIRSVTRTLLLLLLCFYFFLFSLFRLLCASPCQWYSRVDEAQLTTLANGLDASLRTRRSLQYILPNSPPLPVTNRNVARRREALNQTKPYSTVYKKDDLLSRFCVGSTTKGKKTTRKNPTVSTVIVTFTSSSSSGLRHWHILFHNQIPPLPQTRNLERSRRTNSTRVTHTTTA